MKLLHAAIALSAGLAMGADVQFTWNANNPSEGVLAYKLYEVQATPQATNYTLLTSTTNTAVTVSNLAAGLRCFVVTATNRFGESDYSTQACALLLTTNKPVIPEGLEIIQFFPTNNSVSIMFTNLPNQFTLQHSDTLSVWTDWVEVIQLSGPSINGHAFRVYADRPKAFWRFVRK